jgi:hypothetical protein
MAAPTLSRDDLKRASRHVYYELQMVIDTAEALQFRPSSDKIAENALLESFGVHARALLDFLTAATSDKDDIYAALYLGGAWTKPTLPAVLDLVKNDVNKHFAHITATRLKFELPVRKEWAVLPIAQALRDMVDTEFFQKVDKELLEEHWNAGVPTVRANAGPARVVATGIVASLESAVTGTSAVGFGFTVTPGKTSTP